MQAKNTIENTRRKLIKFPQSFRGNFLFQQTPKEQNVWRWGHP